MNERAVIIIERVKQLKARGYSVDRMARTLSCERKTITNALWRIRNRKYVAQIQHELGKHRYRTEAYRTWNRERVERQYRAAHCGGV